MGRQKTDEWISQVYGAKDRDALRDAYEGWAETYDADLIGTGYLHGAVIAGLVGRHVARREAAILDAGVGTGAIGYLLSLLGYNNLTGIDLSPAMLAKAQARQVYSDLRQCVLGEVLPFPDGAFDAMISTGTFTTGHAPASAFDEIVRVMEPGGVMMFTVGTRVWDEQGFRLKIETLEKFGKIKHVETTPIYRPMPYSATESEFTTRAHVYRKT